MKGLMILLNKIQLLQKNTMIFQTFEHQFSVTKRKYRIKKLQLHVQIMCSKVNRLDKILQTFSLQFQEHRISLGGFYRYTEIHWRGKRD